MSVVGKQSLQLRLQALSILLLFVVGGLILVNFSAVVRFLAIDLDNFMPNHLPVSYDFVSRQLDPHILFLSLRLQGCSFFEGSDLVRFCWEEWAKRWELIFKLIDISSNNHSLMGVRLFSIEKFHQIVQIFSLHLVGLDPWRGELYIHDDEVRRLKSHDLIVTVIVSHLIVVYVVIRKNFL